MHTFRAEGFERSLEEIAGERVGVTSYRLGDVFVCKVDNVSPGANIARATGATREEAREIAFAAAARRLARTRRFPTT